MATPAGPLEACYHNDLEAETALPAATAHQGVGGRNRKPAAATSPPETRNPGALAGATGADVESRAAHAELSFKRIGQTIPIRLERVAADVVDGLLGLRQGDDAAVFRLADDLAQGLGPTEVRFLQRAAEIASREAPPYGWTREAWARVVAEAWR